MDRPTIHGDPMTVEAIQEYMDAVRDSIAKDNEERRHGPRHVFLISAEVAGFSPQQAEFMWNFLATRDNSQRLF